MSNREPSARTPVPVAEYIHGTFVPLSRLAHDWEAHAGVTLSPSEDRTILRETAAAIPNSIAQRIGLLRVLVVPYVACSPEGDLVSWTKPEGETHSAVWLEADKITHLVLPCRELDTHDTGFEFLASIAELLRPRLTEEELEKYTQMLEEELQAKVTGEIDEESLAAKQRLAAGRGRRPGHERFEEYRNVSLVSTVAEYMHGLWHDVQIRVGPEHLPLPQLRRRMTFLAELFPPNKGYSVFAKELETQES